MMLLKLIGLAIRYGILWKGAELTWNEQLTAISEMGACTKELT